MERLQKYIARSGIASRRKAEELIIAGRVKVNGLTVRELGQQVGPKDKVAIDDQPIEPVKQLFYYALNKPRGIITTNKDEGGRKTVFDLVPQNPGLVACGRLDADSRGLVILTNDGELCHELTHPKFGHQKEYRIVATINKGPALAARIKRLEEGVDLPDGKTSPAIVRNVKRRGMRLEFDIVVHEGKNRQVRRMGSAVGLDVVDLARTRIGRLELGNLPEGRWKQITVDEIL